MPTSYSGPCPGLINIGLTVEPSASCAHSLKARLIAQQKGVASDAAETPGELEHTKELIGHLHHGASILEAWKADEAMKIKSLISRLEVGSLPTQLFELRSTMNITRRWSAIGPNGPGGHNLFTDF